MTATKTLLGLLACAALLAATPPASAQERADASGAEAIAPDPGADWATWIGTLEDEAKKLRELEKTVAALDAEVSRARSRRYPRGAERERLFAAHERARNDLADARRQLPELLEQARRAGVPQGMLQEYEALAETPASAQ